MCRQIHVEAALFPFSINTFNFTDHLGDPLGLRREGSDEFVLISNHWRNNLSPAQSSQIQHLAVLTDAVRKLKEDDTSIELVVVFVGVNV
jgi:hypothetical protein